MRTRTNYEKSNAMFISQGYYSDGRQAWSSSSPFTSQITRSTIIDTVGWGQNPVAHTKFETSPMSYQTPVCNHVWMPYKASVGYQQFFPLSGPVGLSWDPVDYTSAVDALLSDASGAMPIQASAVVNLIELNSIKEIVPQVLSGIRGLLKHKVHRQSLKELANLNLLYQFGVAPLVSDIKSFLNIRGVVKKRIKQLEQRSCRTVRLTQRVAPKEISMPMAVGTPSSKGLYISGEWSGTVSGAVSADVASFFVNDTASQVKLYSSALGLSSPLTNAWEIVPFSFVADWFLPIGETFQRLENRLGLHETVRSCSLSNVMHSVKVQATLNASAYQIDPEYPDWADTRLNVPRHRYTYYERQPGLPVCPLITPPSGWGLNRTGLSLSLIAQKVIKR